MRIFLKLSLAFLSLFVSILCVEFIVRISGKKADVLDRNFSSLENLQQNGGRQKKVNIGKYDEDLGWAYEPNKEDTLITSDYSVNYKINAKGLRDEEYDYEKKSGIFRVIALGESHTFGEGIAFGRRYSEIIEQGLNDTEVVNMGVWGFGIDQALLYFEKEGLKYKPDLVILFINKAGLERCWVSSRDGAYKPYFELDVNQEKLSIARYREDKDKYRQEQSVVEKIAEDSQAIVRSSAEKDHKKLLKNSLLFRYLEYRFFKARVENKLKEEIKERDREFWSRVGKSDNANFNTNILQETQDKIIDLILGRYSDDCKNANSKFLIINIDTQELKLVEEYCRQNRVAYLDLSAVLTKASNFKKLRFEIDPHYNEFANRVIGEYVLNYLSDKYSLKQNSEFSSEFLNRFN